MHVTKLQNFCAFYQAWHCQATSRSHKSLCPPMGFWACLQFYHSDLPFRICFWLGKILIWSTIQFSKVPSKSPRPEWKSLPVWYKLIPAKYCTLLNGDFLLQLPLVKQLSDTFSLHVNIYEMYLCSLTHFKHLDNNVFSLSSCCKFSCIKL